MIGLRIVLIGVFLVGYLLLTGKDFLNLVLY